MRGAHVPSVCVRVFVCDGDCMVRHDGRHVQVGGYVQCYYTTVEVNQELV